MERISIFGLGRVGLIMAAALAKHGYQVSGIDTNSYLVEKLCEGQTTFYEPNLTEYLSTAIQNKKFVATQDYKLSSKSDVVYIAVGTPSRADGSINLSYIQEASKMIGQSLKNAQTHQLVVVKSTVLPGTARNLVKPTIEAESGKVAGRDFSICSNPEFLREGRAIRDTEFPDRIIIGSDQAAGIEKLENLYRSFHAGNLPTVIRTSFENAELIKYANNTFLAAKVSLINSIAGIAEHVPHADVKVVAEGIGLDTRIGPQFLNAGLGWGGSCWPKDLAALLYFGRNAGSDTQLINAVIDVNRKQAEKAANFAKDALGSLEDKRIAILGLAFKPDTDDLRDAVSVPVINRLLRSGAEATVWDPRALTEARRLFGDRVRYATDALNCIDQADCCILVTEWPEFRNLRPRIFKEKMRQPVLIDGRKLYDPAEFRMEGIQFHAIGLGPET